MRFFLKRALASLIDLIIFFLLSGVFFSFLDQEDSKTLVPIFAFISTFLIPICTIKNSLGCFILGITPTSLIGPNVHIQVFLKYVTLYCICSGTFLAFFAPISMILTNYTYLSISFTFLLRINLLLLILNVLVFVFTKGKKNFLDWLFRLTYLGNSTDNLKEALIIGYCFAFSMILCSAIEYNFTLKEKIDFAKRYMNEYLPKEYYPVEVINNYSDVKLLFTKEIFTSKILTFSDSQSFFSNKIFVQKIIIAPITKIIANNNRLKKKCCNQLVYYSALYDILSDRRSVDQTKIILYTVSPIIPYINCFETYTYYFDNKTMDRGIYGGFDTKTLTESFTNCISDAQNSYMKQVAAVYSIPIDTLVKYRTANGAFSFPKRLGIDSSKKIDTINATLHINVKAISFDNVKPVIFYNINLPLGSTIISPLEIEQRSVSFETDLMFYAKETYMD